MTEIRVPFADTDGLGIVHHSNYFRYFEVARVEWLRNKGLTYEKMIERRLFIPLIEANCHYRRPARFDEVLCIAVKFVFEGKHLVFHYVVENKSTGNKLSTGRTTHVSVDEKFKVKTLPNDIVATLTD